jgi:hypothetical protein
MGIAGVASMQRKELSTLIDALTEVTNSGKAFVPPTKCLTGQRGGHVGQLIN